MLTQSRTASRPLGVRLDPTKSVVVTSKGLRWPVFLFLVVLFLPWIFNVGSLALSPYRLVLLGTFVPCVFAWLTGKAGRVRVSDILIILYCVWATISLSANHGFGNSVQTAGILFIETFGPYLMARCYIRSVASFREMIRLLYRMVAILLPFAIFEAFSGRDIILELFSSVLPTHVVAITDPRWGLRRAQTVFEHPILHGVVCGSFLAMVHTVLGDRQSLSKRWLMTGIVGATAFLSFSSGPITALAAQGMLLGWNWLLQQNKSRWKLLWAMVFAGYVLVSLMSNQTVPEFFITHFAFDQLSAGYRVLIWNFGTQSVLNHPIFGVGLGEWDRPLWMPPSIDMFWLAHAVFYGLPGGILMLAAFLCAIFKAGFLNGLDEETSRYKTAYVIAMTGLFLVGWTVHFWNTTYVLAMFLLGSGVFFSELSAEPDTVSSRRPLPQPDARFGSKGRNVVPATVNLSLPNPALSATPKLNGRAGDQIVTSNH